MHTLKSDCTEPESRRSAHLAALQLQIEPTLPRKELRCANQKFACKIYLISFLFTIGVATQWWFLTDLKAVQIFIIIYYYIIIAIIFVNFLILTLLQYVLKQDAKRRPRSIVIIYMIALVEFGSVTISRPTIESNFNTFIYALLYTILVWSISFGLAVRGTTEEVQAARNISLWSQKYYLATAISLLMTIEFSFIYVQIAITFVMTFLLSIFFLIWGRSLGSVKFYQAESKYCNYYTVLTFLNMISFIHEIFPLHPHLKTVLRPMLRDLVKPLVLFWKK